MGLVDITPKMTSNTAPAPYVVNVSSSYAPVYDGWKAFNGVNTLENDCWVTATGVDNGYIQLDFGVKTKINYISVGTRNHADALNQVPKNCILYGSDDKLSYAKLLEINGEILWSKTEVRMFKLLSQVNYRYYKLIVTSTQKTGQVAAIGELKFWQEDDQIEYVSNSKSSLLTTLPHNTTNYLKNKKNDPRTGLLAYADDEENYGTLHMVNKKGQMSVPLASLYNGTVLFEGSATSGTMADDYTNYRWLLITVKNSTTMVPNLISQYIEVLNSDATQSISFSAYGNSGFYHFATYTLTASTNSFNRVDASNAGWCALNTSKSIGFK